MTGARLELGGAVVPSIQPNKTIAHVGLEPTHSRICSTRRWVPNCSTNMFDNNMDSIDEKDILSLLHLDISEEQEKGIVQKDERLFKMLFGTQMGYDVLYLLKMVGPGLQYDKRVFNEIVSHYYHIMLDVKRLYGMVDIRLLGKVYPVWTAR
ncbi:hypothetical protein J6590_097801 [Homalodisca vitripennis]|nr:hypothetical protein J6590_097801 [Homalodisca vitripennis]